MDKEEAYNLLEKKNIAFEKTEHKAVFNMQEVSEIELPYPEYEAKNLFLVDDKKQNFYLLTVSNNKKVNIKDFRKKIGTRPLSFASQESLLEILDLKQGSVSPLGVLNDVNHIVKVFIDSSFEDKMIGVRPNENTATVWLKTVDLFNLIKECGNVVEFIEFD